MKVYSISLFPGANPFTESSIEKAVQAIQVELEQMDVEFNPKLELTIECSEMSEEDYKKLLDWVGP